MRRRRANTPCSRACRPRPRSSRATSARPATACCSISATPSGTRSRPRPASPIGCCMARRSGSAWRSRSSSPRGADCCRRRRPSARSRILRRSGLPTHVNAIPGERPGLDAIMDLISQDKKVRRGRLTFILARGIGQAFVDPRRRRRGCARLPGREACCTMLTEDWLALAFVLVLCGRCVLLFRERDGAHGVFARPHVADGEGRQQRAVLVNRLIETRERMIGAILIGNNVVNIAASAVTTGLLLSWFGRCRRALRDRRS